jgi:hypothetical protein
MRPLFAAIALALLLASPSAVAAQQQSKATALPNTPHIGSSTQARPLAPAVSQWQSYRPDADANKRLTAASGDRDFTSEKLAIAVALVLVAILIIRSVT